MKDISSDFSGEMHWDRIHSVSEDSLSWNENNKYSTLDLIISCARNREDIVADIGCGQNGIIIPLLKMGYKRMLAIDVSKKALDNLTAKVSGIDRQHCVTLINRNILDIGNLIPDNYVKVWHDRFTFHFLVDMDHMEKYICLTQKKTVNGGHIVLTTYADSGPETCSGLPVRRYNHNSLFSLFRHEFELLSYRYADHVTPEGSVKPYVSVVLRKKHD